MVRHSLAWLGLVFLGIILMVPTWLEAQDVTEEEVVERLFEAEAIDGDWFTDEFVAVVPPAQVTAIVEALTEDFGAVERAEIVDGEGQLRLERARVPLTITLDTSGRIAGLWFGQPETIAASPATVAEQLTKLGEKVAIFAQSGNRTVIDLEADTPLGVQAFSAARL